MFKLIKSKVAKECNKQHRKILDIFINQLQPCKKLVLKKLYIEQSKKTKKIASLRNRFLTRYSFIPDQFRNEIMENMKDLKKKYRGKWLNYICSCPACKGK